MKLAELSVKNFQFTLVLVLMAVVAGARALLTAPRSEDPTFPIPIYSVVAVYPGASPTDVEELVVDPLEDRELRRDRGGIQAGGCDGGSAHRLLGGRSGLGLGDDPAVAFGLEAVDELGRPPRRSRREQHEEA